MPATFTTDAAGKITGILTVGHVFKFQGFTFEDHYYCGPIKLNKNGEESARTGRAFWKAWKAWSELPPTEKAATQIA